MCLDDPSEDQKEEFLQEIEQMKLLGAHQNIVSLVGCCTLQEHKFLVIEYVPFGDLLQWLRRRRRSVRRFPKENLINLMRSQGFVSKGFNGRTVVQSFMLGSCQSIKARSLTYSLTYRIFIVPQVCCVGF